MTEESAFGAITPDSENPSDMPPYEPLPTEDGSRRSAVDDFVTASQFTNARPKPGEIRPGEPSKEQIADALLNTPSEIYKVKLPILGSFDEETMEYQYEIVPIVNLTSGNSIKYIAAFAPQFEAVTKNLLPLATIAVQSFGLLKHFSDASRALLKKICKEHTVGEIYALLDKIGIRDYDFEAVDKMQQAAIAGRDIEFMIHMATVFLGPIGEPAMKAIRDSAFSDPIIALSEKMPKLAYASLASSFKRRGKSVTEEELLDRVELMDTADQLDVVYKQFQHMYDRGSIGRFFKQVMGMATMSTAIGMHLV